MTDTPNPFAADPWSSNNNEPASINPKLQDPHHQTHRLTRR